MRWIIWVVVAAVALMLAALCLKAIGAWRWHTRTTTLLSALQASSSASKMPPYDPQEVEGLPAPVQRYFRAVLKANQPMVSSLTLTQSGTFNMKEAAPAWKSFSARQHVTTLRPGFVWDARIAFFPGVPVHVHDAYVAGQGMLRAAFLGLFTIADTKGGQDAAEGELMRYLPEAAWCPTALLPRFGIAWEAIDDTSASATLSDGDWNITMTFRFNSEGLIDTVHSKARSRAVGDHMEKMPWQGRFKNYGVRGGMTVPLYGEVEWLTPTGPKPYFRGSLTSIDYVFAS